MDALRGALWGGLFSLLIWLVLIGVAFAQTVNSSTAQFTTITLDGVPAGDVLLRMMVQDPDYPAEGELLVNGNGPVRLFGAEYAQWAIPPTQTDPSNGLLQYPSLDGQAAEVAYLLPGGWFTAGANVLEFRLLATAGYTVQSITPVYSTEPTPAPLNLDGIAKAIQESPWRLPDWWQAALLRGDWSVHIRTSTSPDWWYLRLWNRETLAHYVVRFRWTVVQEYLKGKRAIDPTVPMQPLDDCDMAIVSGGDAFKLCAVVYASSTASYGYFYETASTAATRVGKAAKGSSCAPWLADAQTTTAGVWWFRGTAPDTGAVGYVRCKDLSK